ncbi:AraC family ethanolamine operon transcriptional activator [Luteibacter rhizovicinus]|uniref:AraC family ethanolamine operon transcriptional activator n=1 Tax=Luteibacter rhizovicinus TaxID=242606 RepID=A0A4R3YGN7_9GAMM|nr:AraC family transcriptional regulator [Luteibacter rhizovicinus]TCV91181.1 AraC family ethanolamine operon transcriptional activator [Luteibacter rhizovicinus]
MSIKSDKQGLDRWEEFDLVTLGSALRFCDVDLLMLNPARPRATIASAMCDAAYYMTLDLGFDVRGSFTVPEDWCLLAYVHHASERSWCQGVSVDPDMAVTLLPGVSTDFMFERGARVTLVLVPASRFRACFAARGEGDPEASSQRLRLFCSRSPELAKAYEQIRDELPWDGGAVLGPVDDLVNRHIAAAMASTSEDRPMSSRGRRAHYLVLRRAERFMRANLRRDIYAQELCQAAGASERGLRYAFDDLLGVPPNRYLAMLRLCVAHRSLVTAEAGRRSVKSVALSCGMWDLSRFAEKYRHMFGEQPRETLTRATQPSDDLSLVDEYDGW